MNYIKIKKFLTAFIMAILRVYTGILNDQCQIIYCLSTTYEYELNGCHANSRCLTDIFSPPSA